MQFIGTLRRWDEGRGFGFIAPTQGGPEVFVHISEFPRDGTHPTEGERLRYDIAPGRDGRPRAVRVVRLAFGAERPVQAVGAAPRVSKPRGKASVLGPLTLVAIIAAAGTWGSRQLTATEHRRALAAQPAMAPHTAAAPSSGAGSFRCDGRTHCSQMTSCAEATWFLNHCPGTQMDGNHDGVPCEQQWCTGPWAK